MLIVSYFVVFNFYKLILNILKTQNNEKKLHELQFFFRENDFFYVGTMCTSSFHKILRCCRDDAHRLYVEYHGFIRTCENLPTYFFPSTSTFSKKIPTGRSETSMVNVPPMLLHGIVFTTCPPSVTT